MVVKEPKIVFLLKIKGVQFIKLIKKMLHKVMKILKS